jgi:seryl-tRNA synthetase
MLDFKFIREKRDLVESSLKKRKVDFPLDRLLELDSQRRSLIKELQDLRHKRNVVTEQVAAMKREGKDASNMIIQMKEVGESISTLEKKLNSIEEELAALEFRMPNIVMDSVPEGAKEEDNVVMRTWGEIRQLNNAADHIDIGLKFNLIDVERAARASGSRFYYLIDDLVRLNHALVQYGLDFCTERGMKLLQPPYMLKGDVMKGAVDLIAFEDSIYKIEGEDLYLLTTSEHAILAFHMKEIIEGKKLPLRYAGISPCFRREAGAHGRDTKGIFRVHQFEKVEQFVFCRPEESEKEHEILIKNAEEFFQSLGIPYRVVNICSGELGAPAAKKYDLEAWLPGQGKYREMVSASNCTDWQARRLGIRFRDKISDEPQYLHTLNSTLVATERAMIAIMENFQNEKGFEVPKVLRKYMNGQELIPLLKE